MKLFKILSLVFIVVLIGNTRASPYDGSDLDRRPQNETNDGRSESEAENTTEENQTDEGDCNQNDPNGKQPANESNEIESNGNAETSASGDGKDTNDNNENGSCTEQEGKADKGSDSYEHFKEKVEDTIDDVKNYINAVLGCQFHTPGFSQCILSGEAVGFVKGETSDNPIPTDAPEMKDNNMTEFTYTLGDWMKFLLSRDIEKPNVTFAPSSVSGSE